MELDEKRFITPQEAATLMKAGDYVHTFRNAAGILIGAELPRAKVLALLEKYPDAIEITGETARSFQHGIAVVDDVGPLFIETDMDKLTVFDPVPENPTDGSTC